MKLFGNSKRSRHAPGDPEKRGADIGRREPDAVQKIDLTEELILPTDPAWEESSPEPEPPMEDDGKSVEEEPSTEEKKKRRVPILARVMLIVLAILLALAAALVVYYKTQVKPPPITADVNRPNRPSAELSGDASNAGGSEPGTGDTDETETPGEEGEPIARDDRKYTFLAVGMDDGNGNTDTIMVATFDTANYTLNVVSIPRDTLVNVSWNTKKVNTLYSVGKVEGLLNGIANLIGFRPDFYGIVDLDAFMKLIDAIGGVDYTVTQNMNYDDPAQDLHIHFTAGLHHFNGEEAMEFMRFRKGYADADIGRIHAQQDFLLTAAQQILENKGNIPIRTLAEIFISDVKTGLDLGECIWFAEELLKMDIENVNFYTMPGNYNDYVNGVSYVTVYVDEWLEMINAVLNPFEEPITAENLDILTRNSSGALYATSGVKKGSSTWGQ